MCSLVSVFTLFYLILENMSTNVRQFRFPCYIWHSWRCVLLHGSFLCCHLLYLIIYLLCMVLPLKIFLTYCSTFAKYSTGFHEKSNLVQILRAFFTKQYFSDFFAHALHGSSETTFAHYITHPNFQQFSSVIRQKKNFRYLPLLIILL